MAIEEKQGYYIVDREETINDIIYWISESTSENDKILMKKDLKMLMSWTCKRVYSAEKTNAYIEIA